MPVSPDDIYKYALHIKDDTSEASLRTVVSRIYYSLYYSCLDLAGKLSLPEPLYSAKAKGLHDTLVKKYSTHNPTSVSEEDKNIRKLGVMLGQLKSYRTEADYKINLEIPLTHVDYVVVYSKKLHDVIALIKSSNGIT